MTITEFIKRYRLTALPNAHSFTIWAIQRAIVAHIIEHSDDDIGVDAAITCCRGSLNDRARLAKTLCDTLGVPADMFRLVNASGNEIMFVFNEKLIPLNDEADTKRHPNSKRDVPADWPTVI